VRRLYHLALEQDWARAAGGADYDRSTIGRSLADEGFIHCSFAEQVQAVADRFYRERADVIMLEIDADALRSPVKIEPVPGGETFPHIYGPIIRDAVLRAVPVPLLEDGRLDVPAAMAGEDPR
jgi:uncharacterized protein (DUF952 family)